MKNNNTLSRQAGVVGKLMLVVILGAISSGVYIANKKGLVSASSISSIVSRLNDKLSGKGDHTGYGVQVLATEELNHATSVMDDFADDGYSAFVLASKNKDRTIYKVRLGPYVKKPEADAIKDKIKERYPKSPYLKSSFIVYRPN